jgi:hypothetical protein
MFLVKNENFNFEDALNEDVMLDEDFNPNELNIMLLEQELDYQEIVNNLIIKEHFVIINNKDNNELLQEGLSDTLKEWWEAIKKFFAKIWETIKSFFAKIGAFIKKLWTDKETPTPAEYEQVKKAVTQAQHSHANKRYFNENRDILNEETNDDNIFTITDIDSFVRLIDKFKNLNIQFAKNLNRDLGTELVSIIPDSPIINIDVWSLGKLRNKYVYTVDDDLKDEYITNLRKAQQIINDNEKNIGVTNFKNEIRNEISVTESLEKILNTKSFKDITLSKSEREYEKIIKTDFTLIKKKLSDSSFSVNKWIGEIERVLKSENQVNSNKTSTILQLEGAILKHLQVLMVKNASEFLMNCGRILKSYIRIWNKAKEIGKLKD